MYAVKKEDNYYLCNEDEIKHIKPWCYLNENTLNPIYVEVKNDYYTIYFESKIIIINLKKKEYLTMKYEDIRS